MFIEKGDMCITCREDTGYYQEFDFDYACIVDPVLKRIKCEVKFFEYFMLNIDSIMKAEKEYYIKQLIETAVEKGEFELFV